MERHIEKMIDMIERGQVGVEDFVRVVTRNLGESGTARLIIHLVVELRQAREEAGRVRRVVEALRTTIGEQKRAVA